METCVQDGNCSPDFSALNDLIDSIDMLPYLTIALGNWWLMAMMTFMIIDSNIMTSLISYYINFDTEFVTSFVSMQILCNVAAHSRPSARSWQWHIYVITCGARVARFVKVSKFKNEFMKPSYLIWSYLCIH